MQFGSEHDLSLHENPGPLNMQSEGRYCLIAPRPQSMFYWKYISDGFTSIVEAGFNSTIKSTIWSGRPLRALATPYVVDWEKNRQAEIIALQSRGKVVLEHELDKLAKEGRLTEEIEDQAILR